LLYVGLSSFKGIYPCDIGVYQVAKDVSASYDVLVALFEHIEKFLGRLEIYKKIHLPEAMEDILVKIMIEILTVLALATKEIKQAPLSEARPR
jgi:hypothetical protein